MISHGGRATQIKQVTYYGNSSTDPSNAVHMTDFEIIPAPSFGDRVNIVYNPGIILDTDSDGMPDAWEVLYGFNTNINDALIDSDGDMVLNIHEFEADTNPRTNVSFLGISEVSPTPPIRIKWHGGTGAGQTIEYSSGPLGNEDNWHVLKQMQAPTPVENEYEHPLPLPGIDEGLFFRVKARRQ